MVPSCHLSAWAGGSAKCCWAHSGSWWHQSSVGTFCHQSWQPSAGIVVPKPGSKSMEQGSLPLQGTLPRTLRNCWWCQPFAVAASHPEAGLQPSSRKASELVAPGELTPGNASCVESHSGVLVLPSLPPELGTLFQPDVATATVKPGPPPRVLFKTQRYFKPSACQHKISHRAASLEELRSLPTSPSAGSIPFPPPARGDKGTGKLLRRMTLGTR